MMQRMNGMKCPRDTGGLMRRGVVLLAALLLVCTLMAGAVSAEDNSWDTLYANLTTGDNYALTGPLTAGNTSLTIEEGNTVTLDLGAHNLSNTTANGGSLITLNGGNLTITGNSGVIFSENTTIVTVKKGKLTVSNGVTLNTSKKNGIGIYGNEGEPNASEYSVVDVQSGATIDGGATGIAIITTTTTTGKGVYGVNLTVNGVVKTTVAPAFLSSKGGTIGIGVNGYVNNVAANNSVVLTGNVPQITIGQSAQITAVRGTSSGTNAINSNDGPAVYAPGYANWIINGGTFTGDEALSIKAGNFTINGGSFTGKGVYRTPAASWNSGSEATGGAVSITTNGAYAQNVNITINGGTFTSANQSAFYEGHGSAHQGTALKKVAISGGTFTTENTSLSAVTIQNSGNTTITGGISITNGTNNLLYRGVNLTSSGNNYNAKWGSDNTGYTLDLSTAGTYKLMDAFSTTGTGIQITADGVTLDGNDNQITGSGEMKGYILNVKTTSGTTTTGVTLDKLNITTSNTASHSTGSYGFLTLYNKTILKNSKLNFSGYTSSTGTMVPSVYFNKHTADNSQVLDNTIQNANKNGASSSSTRGIVIDGVNNVLIHKNIINLGTSKNSSDSTLTTSNGIEIKGITNNATITENTIIAGTENAAIYLGIYITPTITQDSNKHVITSNIFNQMKKNANYSVIRICATTGDPYVNLTVTGNTFGDNSEAGNGIWAYHWGTANLTLLGTIKDNDFNKANKVNNILFVSTGVNLTNNADWGAAAKTIKVTGNTSIENGSTNKETLMAEFTDGSSAAFNWEITGTSGIISLSATTGSSVTYNPVKVGTTNLTVSSGTVSKTILITVYQTTEPNIDTTVTLPTQPGDNTTIAKSSGGSSTIQVSDDKKTATVTDTETNTQIVITYKEPATTSSEGSTLTSVEGEVETVVAVYPQEVLAADPESGTTETSAYQLTLTLKNVTTILPKIIPAINATKEAKITDLPGQLKVAAMIEAVAPEGHSLSDINKNISTKGIEIVFMIPKDSWIASVSRSKLAAYHIPDEGSAPDKINIIKYDDTGTYLNITVQGTSFSGIALAASTTPSTPVPTYTPVYSSSSGNMDGALRVLFETSGGSFISPATGLSYGDKISQPANPVKDGYTFAGWYKDEACTQAWSFSDGIPSDMTLYAKWTGGSSSSQSSSQQSGTTTQPTAKATSAPASTQSQSGTSATSAPVSTTAASGVSPTMTQAPAPVLGALLGLLAAGVLLRRRE